MIFGIGTDIVSLKRIAKIKDKKKFLQKFFSEEEIKLSAKYKGENLAGFLARRFAGKEAVAKALGTGLGTKISFKDISIESKKSGAPQVYIDKKILQKISAELKDAKINISLSDDKEIKAATAFVVIEV